MASIDNEAPLVPRLPEELLILAGRIATFERTQQVSSKRRASTTKKKTAAKENVKWPHTLPPIESLAQAGFYYKPVPESSDNVRCFTCGANLDGWEPGDDPTAEHIKHAPTCAWAINLAIGRRMDETEEEIEGEEDPMCDALVEARTATFHDLWPHENKKGWKVKVKKMVDAGWCYDPSGGYDDGVKCFYCGLALDGWEPKDDPSKEHLDRRPDCPFYILKYQHAAERKAAGKKAGKTSKGRTSRASKVSNARTSMESVGTALSEAPSMMSLGDNATQIDDSIMSTASTATTKGRGPAKGRKKATASRKVSETSKVEVNTMEIDEPSQAASQQNYEVLYPDLSQADENEAPEELPAEKPKTKAKGKKKASSSVLASISAEAPVLPPIPDFSDSEIALIKPKPKRGRAKKNVIDDSEIRVAPVDSFTAKEARDSEMSSMEAALSELTPRATKETRGKKRDSEGMLKLDSSVMILQGTPDPPPAKATRGRKKVKLSEEPNVDSSAFDTDPSVPVEAPVVAAKQTKKSTAKAAPKPRKGKKAATPPPASPEPEEQLPEIEPEVEADAELAQDHVEPMQDTPEEEEEEEAEPMVIDERYATPEPSPQAASPAPLTPTPARIATHHIPSTSQRPTPRFSATPVQAPRSNRRTPESSPIPSDSENQPPSTLPSAHRPPPPLQTNQKIPPASTPTKSTTTAPTTLVPTWTPTDLESIFLTSPIKSAYSTIDLSTLDTKNLSALKSIVEKVRATLGPEEREMSVEQWIQAVAERGEERLRRECEALVMVFEREGVRALGVLEGVEVV